MVQQPESKSTQLNCQTTRITLHILLCPSLVVCAPEHVADLVRRDGLVAVLGDPPHVDAVLGTIR